MLLLRLLVINCLKPHFSDKEKQMKFHIFHNWTKWTKIGEGRLVDEDNDVQGYYVIQQRTCLVCGYVERKCQHY